jgi:hypothetical protein
LACDRRRISSLIIPIPLFITPLSEFYFPTLNKTRIPNY